MSIKLIPQVGECIKMKPGKKLTLMVLTGGLLLTPFTNCEVYTQSSVFNSNGSASCIGAGCVNSSSDGLELNAAIEIVEAPTVPSFDTGGDCNEGGFPQNTVVWQILVNGVLATDCRQLTTCGQCVNGRYQIRPSFPSPYPLSSFPGAQLVVEIIGIDNSGAQHSGRPVLSKRVANIRSL